jgi:cysteine-rich repeat protein
MKRQTASMTLALLVAGAAAVVAGCPVQEDELPGDVTTQPSGGGGGGSATCGDGVVAKSEECDDKNTTAGDGCDESCHVETCWSCSAMADKPSLCVPKAQGDMCEATKFCDGNGKCVECLKNEDCGGGTAYCFQGACAKCDDNIKNGDETDVDCGGSNCTTKCAQGKTCAAGTDCATTFCADGVCCGEACTDACYSCNLPGGTPGSCDFLDKYGEDPSYGNGMSCLAANGLACAAQGGGCKKAVGVDCMAGGDCASGKCADPDMDGKKTCVKLANEACMANGECFSNMCTNGKCM